MRILRLVGTAPAVRARRPSIMVRRLWYRAVCREGKSTLSASGLESAGFKPEPVACTGQHEPATYCMIAGR